MLQAYLELFNSTKKVKANGLMGHKDETELKKGIYPKLASNFYICHI